MKYLIYALFIVIGGIGAYYFFESFSSFDPTMTLRNPASDRLPAKAVTCKYVAYDLKKPILGVGTSLNAARADASAKCFDIRMHAIEAKNLQDSDYYERGLINIDECVNIRCS